MIGRHCPTTHRPVVHQAGVVVGPVECGQPGSEHRESKPAVPMRLPQSSTGHPHSPQVSVRTISPDPSSVNNSHCVHRLSIGSTQAYPQPKVKTPRRGRTPRMRALKSVGFLFCAGSPALGRVVARPAGGLRSVLELFRSGRASREELSCCAGATAATLSVPCVVHPATYDDVPDAQQRAVLHPRPVDGGVRGLD